MTTDSRSGFRVELQKQHVNKHIVQIILNNFIENKHILNNIYCKIVTEEDTHTDQE